MSTITENQRTRPTRPSHKAVAWLAAALFVAAVAVVLVFAFIGSDDETAAPAPSAAQTAPGERYDGGPEEGTRGLTPAGPTLSERYDGGPEEGTRGPTPFGGARP
jgi:hypothetical protein